MTRRAAALCWGFAASTDLWSGQPDRRCCNFSKQGEYMSDTSDKSRKGNKPIDRRTLLGGTAVMGGLLAAQSMQPAAAAPTKIVAAGANGKNFTVSIVGEAMVTRPFSMQTDPAFTGIVKILRESDLSYAHLEMNIARDDELGWAMRGSSGGAGYLVADPRIAEDLAWAGIDTMSVANNHSLDWGPEGLLATIKNCNKAGIAVAGTGH